MGRRNRSLALVTLVVVMVLGAACGAISTSICGLATFTASIQGDLETLAGLDPALVAQAGTPENATALATLDALEATLDEAQTTLDESTDDEVGPLVRAAFQAVLDATSNSAVDLRSAIDSGEEDVVVEAIEGIQLAIDAIGAFQAVVGDSGIDCPGASPSLSAAASPSLAPSVAPTPVVTPTPAPTPVPPTATPEPVETPEPAETPEPEDTPSPTAAPATPVPTPTATPTPSPTPSPSPSASATASESASAEPSPSPSGEGDEGSGLLPWIIVLGLLGTGAAAIVLWYTSRNEPPTDTPPTDVPPAV